MLLAQPGLLAQGPDEKFGLFGIVKEGIIISV